MNARELMIGDWVRIKDLKDPYKRLSSIDEYRGKVDFWDGEELIVTSIDNVSPIPLTGEILEKNGFKIRRRYIWERRDNYCCVKVHIAPKMEIEGEIFDEPPILLQVDTAIISLNIIIEYVHELQNALRLCGVEKEITI